MMLCSIQLDPTTVDVNVHPTKREVHFLEEEAITECIADAVQAKLTQSGERTFEYQVGATSCMRLSAASYSLPSIRRSSLEASLPRTPIHN
jgi:DNA mismatch repair protein MLH1